jgi:hypothetical protein
VNKRKTTYAVLFVIGLGLLPLGISGNTAFLGVAVVFFIAGAAGLARENRTARERNGDEGAT